MPEEPEEPPVIDEIELEGSDSPDLDELALSAGAALDPVSVSKRRQARSRRKQISGGRIALLTCAFIPGFFGMLFLGLWALSRSEKTLFIALVNIAVAMAFGAMYAWARKDAVRGLQAGIGLVAVLLVLDAAVIVANAGTGPIGGLILHLVMLSVLAKGLAAARRREQIRNNINKLYPKQFP